MVKTMSKIQDYPCGYEKIEQKKRVMEESHKNPKDVYQKGVEMAEMSLKLKEVGNTMFCELPFCHTIEVEAFGGIVTYGNDWSEPRIREFSYEKLEELLELPKIDFENGRMQEVLKGCQYLSNQKEEVLLKISGPLTILNGLLPTETVLRGLVKQEEQVRQICDRIVEQLVEYVKKAYEKGVRFFSYADGLSNVQILGQKMTKKVTEQITYPCLKAFEQQIEKDILIFLCPKTTYALLGTEKGKIKEITFPTKMSYGEASQFVRGKERFVGQMCTKEMQNLLKNDTIQIIQLI